MFAIWGAIITAVATIIAGVVASKPVNITVINSQEEKKSVSIKNKPKKSFIYIIGGFGTIILITIAFLGNQNNNKEYIFLGKTNESDNYFFAQFEHLSGLNERFPKHDLIDIEFFDGKYISMYGEKSYGYKTSYIINGKGVESGEMYRDKFDLEIVRMKYLDNGWCFIFREKDPNLVNQIVTFFSKNTQIKMRNDNFYATNVTYNPECDCHYAVYNKYKNAPDDPIIFSYLDNLAPDSLRSLSPSSGLSIISINQMKNDFVVVYSGDPTFKRSITCYDENEIPFSCISGTGWLNYYRVRGFNVNESGGAIIYAWDTSKSK